jgi:chemotaxis protein MotA
MMFDILQKVRKEGLMAIEKGRRRPPQLRPCFKKYPNLGNDHHVVRICDGLSAA